MSFLNRKKNPDEYNNITLRHVYIEYELEDSTALSAPGDTIQLYHFAVKTWPAHSYYFIYNFGNQVKYNPYDFKLTLGQTLNFGLASLEYNQTISFNRKGRGLEYRVFVGFNDAVLYVLKLTASTAIRNMKAMAIPKLKRSSFLLYSQIESISKPVTK